MNTKTKILYKALDLYSISGYAGVSIRTLAKEVGIRESAIYNHYNSKIEILNSIFSEFKPAALNREVLSEDLLDLLPTPEEFFTALTVKIFNKWNNDIERKLFRLLLLENINHNNLKVSFNEYNKEAVDLLVIIFEQLINYNFIKNNDSELLAYQYYSVLLSLRIKYLLNESKSGLDDCIESALLQKELFWKFIKK